ncbi:MAG: DUF4363 family protein [Oscillospiraceae bacterium]|nr:DUF4363 family protein [Oscillospiraceae bacterium]
MNRVRAAIVILAFLIAFSVFGHISIKTTTKNLLHGLQQLEQSVLVKDYTAASRQVTALMEQCQRDEELLTIFVKRDLYNTLWISLVGLQAYLSDQYFNDMLMELARTKASVDALHQQYFSLA